MRNLKRALSLALASVMLLGMMVVGTSAASYPDVDEKDNVEAIEVLNAVKVMIGDRGNFAPDRAVTRNDMAVIMAKLVLGNETADNYVGTHPFTDVVPWADKYVAACYENGLVSGTSATTYGGGNPLTAVQAAAMMLRALGYKDLSKGASDWRAPVTAMANQIRLFSGVASNPSEQLDRNQVAQLALNTLKSPVVDLKDGTFDITSGDGQVVISGGSREYIVRSSREDYARAINRTETSGNSASGVQGYTVELGEHLYNGKLTLRDDYDDFGRPARKWEYDGVGIGTYAKTEQLRAEYTTKVTGKMLYDLLGSSTVNNINSGSDPWTLNVTIDGNTGNAAQTKVFGKSAITRTNTDAVGETGNGVLTQVYVDGVDKVIDIAIINTYLAIAEGDYNTTRDEVSLNVYNLEKSGNLYFKDTTGAKDQDESLKAAGDDFDIDEVKKDDKFLVTVAAGEIKSMAAPEVLSEQTITSHKVGKYVVAGQQYDYATTAQYDVDVMDTFGSVDLKEVTYDIMLDKYGYLIGVEQNEKVNQYVFLTGIDNAYSYLSKKNVPVNIIHLDGTMETVTMDTDDSSDFGTLLTISGVQFSQTNTWCTYSVDNSGIYTLTKVANTTSSSVKVAQSAMNAGTDIKINSKNISLDGSGSIAKVHGNDDTVYINATLANVQVANGQYKDIVDDVDSVATGVTNVDLTVKNLAAGTAPTNEVYTLYNNKGIIIAVVTLDAEDNATTARYAYISSSNIDHRDYDAANKEYSWYREAIVDGEFVMLKEVDDSSASTHLASMTQGKWYEIKYNADDEVRGKLEVTYAINESDDATYNGDDVPSGVKTTTTTNVGIHYMRNANHVANAFDKTFILNSDFTAGPPYNTELKYVGGTLYVGNDATKGVYVSPTAKVVVYTKNYDKHEEYTGTEMEKALSALVDKEHFNGYVNAVIGANGIASVVILDEKTVPATPQGKMTLTVNYMCDGAAFHTITGYEWDGTGTVASVAAAAATAAGYTVPAKYTGTPPTGTLPAFVEDGTGTLNAVYTDNTANQVNVWVTFKDADGDIVLANQKVTLTLTDGVAFLTNAILDGTEDGFNNIVPANTAIVGTVNELINANNQIVNVTVAAATRAMKLPVGYKYSWADGAGYDVQTEATATADAIDVPVGATVTVKIAGTNQDRFYILNPVAAADEDDPDVKYLTNNGTFQIVMGATTPADADLDLSTLNAAANKYYKVAVTENVTNSATTTGLTAAGGYSGQITATFKETTGDTVGADTFVKATDTVTLTLETPATAGSTAGGAVDAQCATGVAGVTVANVENILENSDAFDVDNDKDVTFTIAGEATAGTGTITLTVTLADG